MQGSANFLKHGIDFADAATVLDDDRAVTIKDDLSSEEDRYLTLGMDALGRVLVVVYTASRHGAAHFRASSHPRERRRYGVSP